jgi:hypothetical protein
MRPINLQETRKRPHANNEVFKGPPCMHFWGRITTPTPTPLHTFYFCGFLHIIRAEMYVYTCAMFAHPSALHVRAAHLSNTSAHLISQLDISYVTLQSAYTAETNSFIGLTWIAGTIFITLNVKSVSTQTEFLYWTNYCNLSTQATCFEWI